MKRAADLAMAILGGAAARLASRLVAAACVVTGGVIGSMATAFAGVPTVDDELPEFKAEDSVSGNLRSMGSDTMLNLMQLWGKEFERAYPAVKVQIEGKGSSTAPPALMQNQAQFGAMSRDMDEDEIDAFESKFGFEPTALRVAVDCVAVFVHKDNPVESLTLAQLERVFSVKGPERVTWGDIGVTDAAWADRPVSLYGRNSASGTYKFFKGAALNKADFKPTVRENPGSAGVVQAVATDRFGVGYSGVGYMTPDVRSVPIAYDEGEPAADPTVEAAFAGEYPLARFLNVYVNYDRTRPIDALRERFVRLIFSKQGQEAVIKDGAYPVPAEVAREDLKKLRLEPGF